MIYHGAVQSVASPCAVFANVALLGRELECCQQEESSRSHAAVKIVAALVARVV